MSEKNSGQKTTNKKKTAIVLILLAVIIIAAIAGILAYLTDTDTADNVFTIGSVDIELWEKAGKDGENNDLYWNNTLNNATVNNETFKAVTNIVPTQVIPKQPYVKNVGRNDATSNNRKIRWRKFRSNTT